MNGTERFYGFLVKHNQRLYLTAEALALMRE
jgi:hypothetical protein